jgi:hypothetical protein
MSLKFETCIDARNLINDKKITQDLFWQTFCKVSRADRLASYEKPTIRTGLSIF